MSDLISRQAAIKALCENGMCGDKKCNAFPCEDVKAIMRIPTIDENKLVMDYCIKRNLVLVSLETFEKWQARME